MQFSSEMVTEVVSLPTAILETVPVVLGTMLTAFLAFGVFLKTIQLSKEQEWADWEYQEQADRLWVRAVIAAWNPSTPTLLDNQWEGQNFYTTVVDHDFVHGHADKVTVAILATSYQTDLDNLFDFSEVN